MGWLLRFHDWLSKVCFSIGALLLLGLTLIIGYEVVLRYIFTRPTTWVMDFSQYILIYGTFFAVPWIFKMGQHTSVDIIPASLSEKPRSVLEAVTFIICALVSAIVVYQGAVDTWDAFQRGTVIVRPVVVPKHIILWVIPFGSLLFFFYCIRHCVRSLQKLRAGPKERAHMPQVDARYASDSKTDRKST